VENNTPVFGAKFNQAGLTVATGSTNENTSDSPSTKSALSNSLPSAVAIIASVDKSCPAVLVTLATLDKDKTLYLDQSNLQLVIKVALVAKATTPKTIPLANLMLLFIL
jgi:hypothetical protein